MIPVKKAMWVGKRKWILIILIPVVAYFLFFSGNENGYTVATAERIDYKDTIVITGEIESEGDISVSFETNGTIEKIFVDEGDIVKKGQRLAVLDTTELASSKREAVLVLEEELSKLRALREGPASDEVARYDAQVNVSEQIFLNGVQNGFIKLQQSINSVRNLIRSEVDTLFDTPTTNPSLTFDTNFIKTQNIEGARKDVQDILNGWGEEVLSQPPRDSESMVQELLQDLMMVSDDINMIYNFVLTFVDEIDVAERRGVLPNGAFTTASGYTTTLLDISNNITDTLNGILLNEKNLKQDVANRDAFLTSDTETIIEQTARVEAVRERLNRANERLNNATLVALFDGIVGEIFVKEGEFVIDSKDVIRITNNTDLIASAKASESDLIYIQPNEEVEIVIDSINDEVVGRIQTVNSVSSLLNGIPVYEVDIELIEADDRIRLGMLIDVVVVKEEFKDILVVPTGAVVREDKDRYVRVRSGGGDATLVPVELGISTGDNIQILSGDIRDGDTVLSNDVKR